MFLRKGETLNPNIYTERTAWKDKGRGQNDIGPYQGTPKMSASGVGGGTEQVLLVLRRNQS